MILRGNHRWELPGNYPVFTLVMVIYHYVERIWRILVTSHSVLNSSALDKSISKEIDYGWALPLTIESLQSIKNAGVVRLGFS